MQDILNQIQIKKAKLDSLRPLAKKQVQNLKKVYDTQLTYNANLFMI